ncbi:MAG: methyltransferase domain-containing protein, partial [Kineosporiaceae bacterium]|nr:methyltransferase domain-containing protein [Aeromicrobium sp.]
MAKTSRLPATSLTRSEAWGRSGPRPGAAQDRLLVAKWASDLRGSVIDAGCGPGHWTDFLRKRGVEAEGVDQVQEF